jgi:hypothetical protein
VLVVFAAAGLVVFRAAQHGMEHRSASQRGRYADELQVFLEDGNLERVAQYVALVEDSADQQHRNTLAPTEPHLDLLLLAEAALYRYFDASPARLAKIQPYLNDEGRTVPTRELAYLVTLSREERAARLASIERLRSDLPKALELEYLKATALEFRNDIDASRKSWQKSADLEPAWLGHRFEQAWFEARQHAPDHAKKLAQQIVKTDPESVWSKLATDVFSLPAAAQRPDAGATVSSPVETYFELLLRSLDAARANRAAVAKDLLEKAATVVNNQAPFLFDAFDWCLAEQQPALAKILTDLPAWPRTAPVAAAKLQRLSRSP